MVYVLKHTFNNPPKPILQAKQSIQNHNVLGTLESLPKQRTENMKKCYSSLAECLTSCHDTELILYTVGLF